jgi:hypothetical protein
MSSVEADLKTVLGTVGSLLAPIAELCIARGATIQAVEEMLRQAFVHEAQRICGTDEVATSRISTMTGLTRREVTRLRSVSAQETPATRSLSTDLLTRWLSAPEYNRRGSPLVIPRSGNAPSFEQLAGTVTRDVHPRSLLAEMERLHLVEHDEEEDTVRLLVDAFVPRDDLPRMLGYLGDNVGDHLRGAVRNVLGAGNQHFEQALFADELSAESVHRARELITAQWRSLLTGLGPQLEALMEQDREAGRAQDQALRVGLYSWSRPMQPPPPSRHNTPGGKTDEKS